MSDMEHSAEVDTKGHDSVSRDAEMVERWQVAADAAPSIQAIDDARTQVKEAESMLAQAQNDYRRAVISRASAFGFGPMAEHVGESVKMLRSWARAYPEIEDLSSVPMRELKRENARIAKLEQRMADREREAEILAKLIEKRNRLAEGLSK